MKLEPVNRKDILSWNLASIMEEFSKMDADCVEVIGITEHYKSATAAYSSFKSAASKFGYSVKVQKKKLYIVKP